MTDDKPLEPADSPAASSKQVVKFLLAGAYNTGFSMIVFAGLYLLLANLIHYTLIAVLTHIVAITNSFLIHRYFVFRSEGPIVKEYFRSYVVYAAAFIASMTMLVLLVEIAGLHPILAQFLTIVVTVAISYFGNSRFTFQQLDRR